MKRKFMSALLLGATILASTSTFVSCKDYDDDIAELRNAIATGDSSLQQLVDSKIASAQAQITTLQGTLTTLEAAEKAAESNVEAAIAQAKANAEAYADNQAQAAKDFAAIQAAAAQEAAIKTAEGQVANAILQLEGSIAAAKAALEGDMSNLDKKLSEAIAKVANDLSEAQVAAALAVQGVQSNLDQRVAELMELITTNAGNISSVANALAASQEDIDEQLAQLLELINTNTSNISGTANALQATQDDLAKQIAEALALIASNTDNITVVANALGATQEDLETMINGKAQDLKELIDINVNSINELSKSIQTNADDIADLVAADLLLQAGVDKAQARADEAYTLAQKAADAAGKAQTAADAAQDAANGAQTTANKNAEDIKANAKKAADELDAVNNALKAQIDIVKSDLVELAGKVAANEAAIGTQKGLIDGMQSAIEELQIFAETTTEGLIGYGAMLDKLMDASINYDERLKAIEDFLEEMNPQWRAMQETLSNHRGEINDIKQWIEDMLPEWSGMETAIGNNKGRIADLATAIANIGEWNQQVSDYMAIILGYTEEWAIDIPKLKTDVATAQLAANEAKAQLASFKAEEFEPLVARLNALEEALKGSDDNNGIAVRVSDLEAAKQKLEDEDGKLADNIQKANDRMDVLDNKIDAINEFLSGYCAMLDENLNALVTGVIVQDTKEIKNLYATVSYMNGSTKDGAKGAFFPYKEFDGALFAKANELNYMHDAGNVYITVNPSTIDASKVNFNLENSRGEFNKLYTPGTAVKENNYLVKKAPMTDKNVDNGFWKLPIVNSFQETDLLKSPKTTVDNPEDDDALYAVTTTYERKTVSEGHDGTPSVEQKVCGVSSKFCISLSAEEMTKFAENTDLTFTINNKKEWNIIEVPIDAEVAEGKMAIGTSGKIVRNKFVEIIGTKPSTTGQYVESGKEFDAKKAEWNAANGGRLNTILAANQDGKVDTVQLVCPNSCLNDMIRLKYYAWNYDGSIAVKTYDVRFVKPLWQTVQIAAEDEMKGVARQTKSYTDKTVRMNFKAFVKTVMETPSEVKTGAVWAELAKSIKVTPEATHENGKAFTKAEIDALADHIFLNIGSLDDKGAFKPISDPIPYTLDPAMEYDNKWARQNQTANYYCAPKDVNEFRVSYDPAFIEPNASYDFKVEFYDKNGGFINTLNVNFIMRLPVFETPDWRKTTAFDVSLGVDDVYAWATNRIPAGDNRDPRYQQIVEYSMFNAFENDYLNDGFKPQGYEASKIIFTDNAEYTAANKNLVYEPTQPATFNTQDPYLLQVKSEAVVAEHKYNFTASLDLFGSGHIGGWADNFNLTFLSPVKYAIIGTRDEVKDVEHVLFSSRMQTNSKANVEGIYVEYREVNKPNAKVVDVAELEKKFSLVDPSNAKGPQIKLFGTARDPRIQSLSIEFSQKWKAAEPKQWANRTNIKFDASKINDADFVIEPNNRPDAVQTETTIWLTLKVTDIWGVTTPLELPINVKPQVK